MTEQDKKLQRAQLHMDLEDAKSEYSYLLDKVFRRIDDSFDRLRSLRENAELQPSGEGFLVEMGHGAQPKQMLTDDDIILFHEQLKILRQRIHNLEMRMNSLLNPSGFQMPTSRKS